MPEEKHLPFTCEQLMEFDELDRTKFHQFAEIVGYHTGCSSAAEEFILCLIRSHVGGIPLMPDNLQDDIAEFRRNFESMISIAKTVVRQYPALVLGHDCGGYHNQVAALKKGERDEQQEALTLDIARRAIHEFPNLVLAEDMPEPWSGILKQTLVESNPQPKKHRHRLQPV